MSDDIFEPLDEDTVAGDKRRHRLAALIIVVVTVLLTAATGLSYTNGSGVLQWSGITVAALTPFTIQPKGQLVGTAITCVGTNAW